MRWFRRPVRNSVATKRRAVAAVKPVHVDVADSTVAAQKSGADAPANVTETKSDDAKSDDTNAKADNGKSVLNVSEIGTWGRACQVFCVNSLSDCLY